jgi:tRNA nucleotidyltransferase (CCA-adding enzyme)
MRAPALLRLLEAADALRQPERFELILGSCEADARGRAGLQDQPYPQAGLLRRVRAAAATVTPEEAMARGLTGERLGAELRRLRCRAVAAALATPQEAS